MSKIPRGKIPMHTVVHKSYLKDVPGAAMQSSGGGIDKYPRSEMDKQQISQGNKNLVEKVQSMPSLKKSKIIAQQKQNAKKRLGSKYQ